VLGPIGSGAAGEPLFANAAAGIAGLSGAGLIRRAIRISMWGTTCNRIGISSMEHNTPSQALCRRELERTLARSNVAPTTQAAMLMRMEASNRVLRNGVISGP
jgi:hypothetical protein